MHFRYFALWATLSASLLVAAPELLAAAPAGATQDNAGLSLIHISEPTRPY